MKIDFLQPLFLQIQSILSSQVVGIYLGGSIATNCFNAETSDIDCYIITKTKLSELFIDRIEKMHKEYYLSNHLYAKRIEISYISHTDILNFNPRNARPYFNEGNFYIAHYGSNFIIELSILRENGITIFGPDVKEIISEISADYLKRAIHRNLSEYWRRALSDLDKFQRSDYQVFAILTMCRTLYSLETNKITSKLEAAHWAKNHFVSWGNLIEEAVNWKPSHPFNHLKETQQFVKYVLDKFSLNEDNS